MKIKNPLQIIQISVFLVLFGRAYQFFFFGAPFRELLWDESLLTPVVLLFFDSWNAYATSANVNFYIEQFTKFVAVLFLATSVLVLFWYKLRLYYLKKIMMGLSFSFLVLMAVCMIKEKNYSFMPVFELAIQIAPIVLFTFYKNITALKFDFLILYFKIAIALTFIPHGLFALGIFPVPGYFIDMTISILKISETGARFFLWTVGLLDILGSVLIFTSPRISKITLAYFTFWGLVTAIARVYSNFIPELAAMSLHNSFYLTIYRLPHGLLPLATYFYIKLNQTNNNEHETVKTSILNWRLPHFKRT